MSISFSRLLATSTISLSASFFIVGCSTVPHSGERAMKIGASKANLDVASSQQELETRNANLAEGMTEDQVFEAIGISRDRFDKLTTKEKLPAIASNAQPQPQTADEIREIQDFLNSLEVYQLVYKNVTEYGQIDWSLDIDQTNTGFDRVLTLVFQDGKLKTNDFDGRPDFIEIDSDNLIWGGLDGVTDTAIRAAKPF